MDVKNPGFGNILAFLVLIFAVLSYWIPGLRELLPFMLAALALAVLLK